MACKCKQGSSVNHATEGNVVVIMENCMYWHPKGEFGSKSKAQCQKSEADWNAPREQPSNADWRSPMWHKTGTNEKAESWKSAWGGEHEWKCEESGKAEWKYSFAYNFPRDEAKSKLPSEDENP